MTGMIKMITVNGLTVITRMTRMAGMTGMWVWMTEITRPMITDDNSEWVNCND